MDSLPRELLDAILEQLPVYDFPVSARFPVLDDESRQTVLDARLVRHCFRDSRALNNLFVAVLEETPFPWHGHDIPRLVRVSWSEYAGRMTTLSLCGMSPSPQPPRKMFESASPWAPCDVMPILRRFTKLKHLRYYPSSPKCLRGICPNMSFNSSIDAPAPYGFPPDGNVVISWLQTRRKPSWLHRRWLGGDSWVGLALDSVTVPLFGNRASYCGIDNSYVHLPRTLKHLSISLTDDSEDTALLGWFVPLKNLAFLEIAISRSPSSLGPWNSFASCRELTSIENVTADYQLPKLKEFRLMSDNQNCFSEHDLLLGLELFPNLRKLGLAHILIESQTNNAASWASFVRRLISKSLERLWLLDPRDLWTNGFTGHAGHYFMSKYWGGDEFRSAAEEVRLVDTESLWVQDAEPLKRRDFDYPGFAIFEQY